MRNLRILASLFFVTMLAVSGIATAREVNNAVDADDDGIHMAAAIPDSPQPEQQTQAESPQPQQQQQQTDIAPAQVSPTPSEPQTPQAEVITNTPVAQPTASMPEASVISANSAPVESQSQPQPQPQSSEAPASTPAPTQTQPIQTDATNNVASPELPSNTVQSLFVEGQISAPIMGAVIPAPPLEDNGQLTAPAGSGFPADPAPQVQTTFEPSPAPQVQAAPLPQNTITTPTATAPASIPQNLNNLFTPTPTDGVDEGHSAPAPRDGVDEGHSAPAPKDGVDEGHSAPAPKDGVDEGHSAPAPTAEAASVVNKWIAPIVEEVTYSFKAKKSSADTLTPPTA